MGNGAGSDIFGEASDVPVDERADGTTGGLVEEDVAGKYALLGVPHYDAPGSSAYLRLGAAIPHAGEPTTWTSPTPTGEDLAALVQGFTDDARDRAGTSTDPAFQPLPETLVTGLNGGLHEGGPIDPTGRQGESTILHTKGGWREHSDGNRISTTRGDKIEVIRGNYKLLVLGRQETSHLGDPTARETLIGDAAGMDMSGGLVDDDSGDLRAPGVGLDIVYNWQPDSDGSWAWTQTTTVGSETPDASNSNYQVVSKSWFDQQISQTGSANKRVSYIGQGTYADVTWTYTNVSGTNDSVVQGGELLTYTQAGSVNDITNVLLSLEARLMIVLGLEIDLSDIIALVQVIPILNTNLWVGIVFDDHVGLHSDVHAGAHMEFRLGLHADHHTLLHAETHTGDHTDLHVGNHLDLHNIHFTTETCAINLADNKIMMGETQLGTYTGTAATMTSGLQYQTSAEHALSMAAAHAHG